MRVPLDTAAHICGVKPGTVRRWTYDGRIIRHADRCPVGTVGCTGACHYDVHELLQWIDTRSPDAVYSQQGRKVADRPPDTRHVRAS